MKTAVTPDISPDPWQLRRVRINSDIFEDPFDALVQLHGPDYRLYTPKETRPSLTMSGALYSDGETYLSVNRTTAFRAMRRRLSDDRHDSMVTMILSQLPYEVGQQSEPLPNGGAVIYDSNAEMFSPVLKDATMIWFGTTYQRIGLPPGSLATPLYFPWSQGTSAQGAVARALAEQVTMVRETFEEGSFRTAAILVDGLIEVLKAAITRKPADDTTAGFRAMRWARLLRYIDENVENPDLGVTSLADRFGMSRAVLYRQFEMFNGVNNYIQERRLQHVYRMLAAGPADRYKIQDLAERLNFTDTAHLSNRFRSLFGLPPSKLRREFEDVYSSQQDGFTNQGGFIFSRRIQELAA